jgi:hypothetical protein
MTDYPRVKGELATLRAVVAGKSIARLGDGELKHLVRARHPEGHPEGPYQRTDGGRQEGCDALTREMQDVVRRPHTNLIVGIPTMDPKGPKIKNWLRHRARFAAALSSAVQYYSAFITRPDSAPWIDNREFGELFQRVWKGRHVAIVAKESNKVEPAVRLAAREITFIECPERNAYSRIDCLEAAVIAAAPDVALLSAGPTATVLAHRLAKRGIQGIDIGSAGAFLCRLLDA